jgi:hypothetical protein
MAECLESVLLAYLFSAHRGKASMNGDVKMEQKVFHSLHNFVQAEGISPNFGIKLSQQL